MVSDGLLVIGGGGHCCSVLDALLALQEYRQIGVIERKTDSRSVLGIPVLGTDDDLPQLFALGWTSAVIAIGSIGNPSVRIGISHRLRDIGFSLPPVVDPTAILGREVSIGEGTFVGKRAVLNAGTRIGRCAIINTGAILEHDCEIGDFAHIGPGAILCGAVRAGDHTHIGAGSVVRQGIQIGSDCMIGVGSVVVKEISPGETAFGNPCKVVKR